jgi:site-specific DNA-methyltransferase (adenine-specific)
LSRRGIYFKPEGKTTEKAIVSVKGGDNVNVSMIWEGAYRRFHYTGRIHEAYDDRGYQGRLLRDAVGKYPKIQILTIAELLEGKQPNIPLIDPSMFKKAQREDLSSQGKLEL